jgi:radical SAM enzyme (TIGR01210 family)
MNSLAITDSKWILPMRGKKNPLDPLKPYSMIVEKERTASGGIEDIIVIFLTGAECPYSCIMCDLWKNTTDTVTPRGYIPEQIEYALERLPSAKHVKLYNSGSFFDRRSVPPEDHERIASLLSDFETVTVECHPAFIDRNCVRFKEMLRPELKIAIGLETVSPGMLRKLNKKMTPESFRKAVMYLKENGIGSRAFILLKPPFTNEDEGIFWAKRSIDFAFDSGAECCTVIPVRAGNGAMEYLYSNGLFSPPLLQSLEEVLEYGISLRAGNVFADTWDLTLFSGCDKCIEDRRSRLNEMNLHQSIIPKVECECSY